MSIARLAYTVLFYLFTPLIALKLLWRALRAPAYAQRWGERWGFIDQQPEAETLIWLHAVSVGESVAAMPLVAAMRARYPQARIFITCMTPTGSQRIRAATGDDPAIGHSYAPYDSPTAIARFLRRTAPQLLIIMETELWPNTIAACAARDIPVVLANARLSARSAQGYGRLPLLVRPMLAQLSCVAAQTDADAARFSALGVGQAALQVTGNIKFDLELDAAVRDRADHLRRRWRGPNDRPIWLVASTHAGEDSIVLAALTLIKRHIPDLLLVLTPRHPERFGSVAADCAQAGFTLHRLSQSESPAASVDILLGDTMGELMAYYGTCDIAFVGGSLVPVGGHNMIEPAAWGRPILCGPEVHNFAEVARLLEAAGAMVYCAAEQTLAAEVIALVQDDRRREAMGAAALVVATANRGALARLLQALDPFELGDLSSAD